VFCGREKETQEILEHCKAGRLVVVTAHPGLGSTTLLKEGIAPPLRDCGFIVVQFHDWHGRFFRTQLVELIADAVRDQADESFLAASETLSEMLARIRRKTGRPVALLLDQFEDYLRCHTGSDVSESFDADISHAAGGHECQVVLALQDHAVDAFQRLEQYIPNLMGCNLRLGPLQEADARLVVTGTGHEEGVQFEPSVVDALVKAPAAQYQGGVHPFYLMAGIRRLLDAAAEKKWTTATAGMIQIYGGADRLILESLDLKLGKLNPTQTDLFFRWCGILLSADEERLAVSAEALSEYSGRLNRFALSLITLLMEEGILRTVELPGAMRYEIARDSLTLPIRDWWKRRETMLIARRRARFRVRSVSLAAGSILALYALWLFLSLKK
jgi:conflict system STAND superfamily ATPase